MHRVCVNWDQVGETEIVSYQNCLESELLNCVDESLMCDSLFCSNESHHSMIEGLYRKLIDFIHYASDHCLPHVKKRPQYRVIPGWNENCKILYHSAKNAYIEWNNAGRPRSGMIFELMKEARGNFRRSLNFCKANELNIRRTKVLEAHQLKNRKSFWKNVQSLNKKKKSNITCIDGKETNDEIIKLFESKYREILNDVQSCKKPLNFYSKVEELNCRVQIGQCKVSVDVLDDALTQLNSGIGYDLIHSNHLKYSGSIFKSYLSRLFSSMIRHSYVPADMMLGEIKPIIKNINASHYESKNYRPVMNSSVLLKLFEYCVLNKINPFICSNPRQFGYKKATSCLTAAMMFKETIYKYTSEKSNLHCAMIDSSKAFDKIYLNILFTTLLDTNMPPLLVYILKFLCENIGVRVNVNNEFGSTFKVGNGTRQGGILSPFLFNFYINEVFNSVSSLSEGCRIGFRTANIFGYADDILLCAPTVSGLQILIDNVCDILDKLCLPINFDKCVYIVFRRSMYENFNYKIVIKGNVYRPENECTYLGMIFQDNLKLDSDVLRCTNSFFKQFNSVYHKFYFMNRDIVIFLMQTYCCSFYASELWFYDKFYLRRMNILSIAYHKAVKRMVNLSPWDNNHYACDLAGMAIFKHLLNSRILSFMFSVLKFNSLCLENFKYYLRYDSFMVRKISDIFKFQYGVQNILKNDLEALKSRINFMQRTEDRSNYFYMPP